MRKKSMQQRKLAVQASALAAVSGTLPVFWRHHGPAGWVVFGVVVALELRLIVMVVRLRRHEGCGA